MMMLLLLLLLNSLEVGVFIAYYFGRARIVNGDEVVPSLEFRFEYLTLSAFESACDQCDFLF